MMFMWMSCWEAADAPEDSDHEEELPDFTESTMPGTYVAAVYEG